MVRAILDGTKTQTRRVNKDMSCYSEAFCYDFYKGTYGITEYESDGNPRYQVEIPLAYCPGDILWVRETFTLTQYGKSVYKADCRDKDGYYWSSVAADINGVKWRPSIHMPRKTARIFLEVKSVRVERLQDITEDDAKKEGFISKRAWIPGVGFPELNPRDWFTVLWDFLNAKRGYSWESNPWVWVIEFARVKK